MWDPGSALRPLKPRSTESGMRSPRNWMHPRYIRVGFGRTIASGVADGRSLSPSKVRIVALHEQHCLPSCDLGFIGDLGSQQADSLESTDCSWRREHDN